MAGHVNRVYLSGRAATRDAREQGADDRAGSTVPGRGHFLVVGKEMQRSATALVAANILDLPTGDYYNYKTIRSMDK